MSSASPQGFGVDISEGRETGFSIIMDEVIASELGEDSDFDLDNWTQTHKRKMSLETYCELKKGVGEILFLKLAISLFAFMYVQVLLNHWTAFQGLDSDSVAEIKRRVFSSLNLSLYLVIYLMGISSSLAMLFKEKYLCELLLSQGQGALLNFGQRYPTQLLNVFLISIGATHKFIEVIDGILFNFLCLHFLPSGVSLPLILVRLTLAAIQLRSFLAISQTQFHDDFTLNNFPLSLFPRHVTDSSLGTESPPHRLAANKDQESNNQPIKPFKILQLSDLCFYMDLFALCKVLERNYILNKHKESHGFNISIYFLWRTLSHDIPVTLLKLILVLFTKSLHNHYLILSLLLSSLNSTGIFLHVYPSRRVINDILS